MHSNLNSLTKIKEALERRPTEISAEKRSGRRVVGWVNYNVPEEILYALDLIPIRLGLGGDDRLVDIGARYISTKNCVYVRELVGLFEEKKDPYINLVDLAAFDATCLQIYRASEIINYYFDVKTEVLAVPRNFHTEEARVFFRKEVTDFSERLENFAGKKLTRVKIAEAIILFNQIRSLILELYSFQAGDNPKISWREVIEVVHAGNYLDKNYFYILLTELINELRKKQGEPVINNSFEDVRVFISGSIIPPHDNKVISIIESLGGRIVGDDLWSGLLPYVNLHINDSTVEAIADGYLGRAPHAALPYLDLESDGRLANLKRLIKQFKAQAVIYHTLRYCDPFTFKGNETKNVLNQAGYPFLEIHTEYAGSDYEPIRTRVEAFIELLRNKNLIEA